MCVHANTEMVLLSTHCRGRETRWRKDLPINNSFICLKQTIQVTWVSLKENLILIKFNIFISNTQNVHYQAIKPSTLYQQTHWVKD